MYDPEASLQRQQIVQELIESTQQFKENCSPDNPFIPFFDLLDKRILYIIKLMDEADNCFDENQNEKLNKEIEVLLSEVFGDIQKAMQVMNLLQARFQRLVS